MKRLNTAVGTRKKSRSKLRLELGAGRIRCLTAHEGVQDCAGVSDAVSNSGNPFLSLGDGFVSNASVRAMVFPGGVGWSARVVSCDGLVFS